MTKTGRVPFSIPILLCPICILPFLQAQNAPVLIGTISIEGNRSLPDRQIRSLLLNTEEGHVYTPENLEADLVRVEQVYQDSGFLNVRVIAPAVQIRNAGDRQTASIHIVVAEGQRYVTGKLAITNAKAIAPESLLQLSPLQQSEPFSRMSAAQWRTKVEDAYRTLGYLRILCPVRETVHEAGKTVDCTLVCSEGKPYSVGKIFITGDTSVNPVEFRRQLLFSEGGIFNPEMLFLSLQFLNQGRMYEPLSTSDVEIKIDDEKGTVDLVLRPVKIAR